MNGGGLKKITKLASKGKRKLLNKSKKIKNSFVEGGIGLKNSLLSAGMGLRSSLNDRMTQIGIGTYVSRFISLITVQNIIALCVIALLVLLVIYYYKFKTMFTFRFFTPSYVINIEYYNTQFAGKLTDLILEFEYLRLNQFEYDIVEDIYTKILNDEMAGLFAEIHTILEKHGITVDMTKFIDTNDKMVKFFKKRFTHYRKEIPDEEILDDIQLIFDTMETIISKKKRVEYVCRNRKYPKLY